MKFDSDQWAPEPSFAALCVKYICTDSGGGGGVIESGLGAFVTVKPNYIRQALFCLCLYSTSYFQAIAGTGFFIEQKIEFAGVIFAIVIPRQQSSCSTHKIKSESILPPVVIVCGYKACSNDFSSLSYLIQRSFIGKK